jgi:NAD(P)H-dependent flavin oxidoreductase YrpB (nitropropane dioxygenase family)
MRTRVSERLQVEYPIFAFSHCRDVVAAVTNGGGFGVLGAAFMPVDQLAIELDWISAATQGRPYGVDLLFPTMNVADEGRSAEALRAGIPRRHEAFVERLLADHRVPPWPDAPVQPAGGFAQIVQNDVASDTGHLDGVFGHPGVRLVACGLGVPPAHLVARAHDEGRLVAALIGRPAHAVRQLNAGVDFLVAQGAEAGGHTGEVATMVLVPQVVAAVGPDVPVIAAGGIGSGRQIAAAMALGAEGVWCGSLWLLTEEAETSPVMREKLLEATSSDTVRSRSWSGKPMRMLRSAWPEAWDGEGAPAPLAPPFQDLLASPAQHRAARVAQRGNGAYELVTGPVGQVVGLIDSIRPARRVVLDLVSEYAEVLEQFAAQHAAASAG